MSLETWKQEFYPTPADMCPPHEAVTHSLRKWRGVLPANLEKHGLLLHHGMIRDSHNNIMSFSSSTCSLCFHYALGDCKECPLYLALDNNVCDSGVDSPYNQFIFGNNPQPMIHALEAALEFQPTERSG